MHIQWEQKHMSPIQDQFLESNLPGVLDTDGRGASCGHPVPESSRPIALWRNLNFLLLVSGQGVSSVGSQISLVAFPLLILALTHSPALTGLMTALRGLPFALLCLPAGALVDRWDRKRVMILCDAGRAIALGSIPVALALGHLTFLQLALVSVIEGTFFVFFNLAETACIPH